jgi:hypothetical protein
MRVGGPGVLDDNLQAYKTRAALSKYSALATLAIPRDAERERSG